MIPVRYNSGILARSETRALNLLITRIPEWITPDMLTALSILGAVLGCIGFAMGLASETSLLLVGLGFALNWLGDSLDGRLARHRQVERKMQGFILDNGFDLFTYFLLALGFAISGLVWTAIPFILLALYVMLSNLSLARMLITGRHDLAVGPMGTTELRVSFLLLAVLLYWIPQVFLYRIALLELTVIDFLSLLWACVMLLAFFQILRADLRMAGKADAKAAATSHAPQDDARHG